MTKQKPIAWLVDIGMPGAPLYVTTYKNNEGAFPVYLGAPEERAAPQAFEYEEKIHIDGRGDIYLGRAPGGYELKLGEEILIDGVASTIVGLDRYATRTGIRPGDPVGIQVRSSTKVENKE